MYDDKQLRAVDEDVADVLKAAFENSQAGAGIIYRRAQDRDSRFDLLVHVETSPQAKYYGYSDVVYTGLGDESYLFGQHKFSVVRAMQGLSLRIVLNLAATKTSAQRLSTLVHEVGVHGTRLWAGLTTFNKLQYSVVAGQQRVAATEQDMAEIQREMVRGDVFKADMHHTEFGEGKAEDYLEFREVVAAVLLNRADNPLWQFGELFTDNKWKVLHAEYRKDIEDDEEVHAAKYWHPKVDYANLLQAADRIDQAATEFAGKAKVGSGGLLGWVKSWTFG
ncbi:MULTISPECIES: hypothetical protein [unclassified Saccharothrix]|uniref:hypothetical protein n=1 Tax=unclassified Saccharothrix TaxID=2593673 RepID=UPI00307E9625